MSIERMQMPNERSLKPIVSCEKSPSALANRLEKRPSIMQTTELAELEEYNEESPEAANTDNRRHSAETSTPALNGSTFDIPITLSTPSFSGMTGALDRTFDVKEWWSSLEKSTE